MLSNLLLPAAAGFSYAICIVLEKQYLLKYFSHQELFMLIKLLSFPLIMVLIYTIPNHHIYNKMANIDTKTLLLLLLTVSLGFLGLYIFFYVLKVNKASFTVSCIQPLIIVFSIFLSVVFFKERMNRYEWLGIFCVLLGLYFLSAYKS